MSASPTTIQKLAASVPQALAMLAAMELDVFTPLSNGPLTNEQLASAVGVRADKLQPLLAVLVSAGLLEAENGQFGNSAESKQYLVKWQPSYMGSVWLLWSDMWHAEMQTAESIRTGVPQAKHDFSRMSFTEVTNFLIGSESGARSAGRLLMQVYDFSLCRKIVDIGGGLGALALTLHDQFPQIHVTVIELPAIASVALEHISALSEELPIAERIKVLAADAAHDDLAGPYDAAVCNRFIQVLSPTDAQNAIMNIVGALEPDGRIFIVGHVLDDTGLSPSAALNYGLLALNFYDGGQAYTEQQHREWLKAAGLVEITRELLPNGYSLMSARKV